MLIMTLAHARATGDGTLIGRYVCLSSISCRQALGLTSLQYDLHKKWADYLVDNAFPLQASQYVREILSELLSGAIY